MESKEWEQAVRIFERMNNRDRHNQQSKKKAGEAALKANNHASLQPTFLTGLEKDGVKTNWDGIRDCLKVGCQVKVDVSRCKDSKWLVFGLYINERVVLDGNNEYSSDIQRGKYSKEFDWMQHFPLGLDVKSSPLNRFESCGWIKKLME